MGTRQIGWGILLGSILLLAGACEEGNEGDVMHVGATNHEGKTEEQAGEIERGERDVRRIVAILRTVNRGEIEAGTYAQENAPQPEVKELAERIIQEHARALAQEDELAREMQMDPAGDFPKVRELEQSHRQVMQELRDATGEDVGRRYVETQIAAHRRTVDDIDRELLPAAEGELRSHVRGVRAVVQGHLESLEQLRAQLTQGQTQQQPDEQGGNE